MSTFNILHAARCKKYFNDVKEAIFYFTKALNALLN